MFKINNSNTKETYGSFIASQKWDIYGTTTYRNPISATANRRIFEKLFQTDPTIDRMFFVSEPFISQNHVHCHFLISSNNSNLSLLNLNRKFSKYGRHQIELISEDNNVKNNKGELSVCYYLTKTISRNTDYDFLIK
jgi:hypothetical protein